MTINTAKECAAQSIKELQKKKNETNNETSSSEVNYTALVQAETEDAIHQDLNDILQNNRIKIEELKRNATQSENSETPKFFSLTWEDIPQETDPNTGEKTYEVHSGKRDEFGNDNPEHDVLNQHPLPVDSTIIVHNPNGTVTIYKTDQLGRVKSMETKNVSLVNEDDRQRDNNATKETKTIKDGKLDDHGGHLHGDQFGGCSEQINLVPMSPETNLSAFKKVEGTIAKATKEGHSVTDYKVEPIYDGDSSRPDGFRVNYKIDGKEFTTIITN